MATDGWNDPELDSKLNQYKGPEDETNTQFIYRTYNGLCDRICKPKRKHYITSDVESRSNQVMSSFHKSQVIDSSGLKDGNVNLDSEDDFSIFENDLTIPHFDVNTIHSIFWLNNKVSSESSQHCLFYLHTNTRSAIEAVELLPICYEAGFHLMAIDLPGHGRTFTHNDLISTQLALAAIDVHFGHLKSFFQISQVVLLGRGMSTALSIEYCSLFNTNAGRRKSRDSKSGPLKPSTSRGSGLNDIKKIEVVDRQISPPSSSTGITAYQAKEVEPPSSGTNSWFSYFGFGSTLSSTSQSSSNIATNTTATTTNTATCDESSLSSSLPATQPVVNPHSFQHIQSVASLILDTPYTSVHALVEDAIGRLQAEGYYVPKFLLDLGANLVRSSVTSRLGFDPYTVKPIELINYIDIPMLILSALHDDYIPIHHAMEIHKHYRSQKQQSATADCCSIVLFEGSHNSARPEAVHQAMRLFIERIK